MSTLAVNEITNEAGTDSPSFFTAPGDPSVYFCRAWVNFDGTGTVSIRESGNVSSITDNGTGDYTVNFTTAMPDANYAFSGKTLHLIGSTNYFRDWQPKLTPTATALRIINSILTSGDHTDSESISVVIFR